MTVEAGASTKTTPETGEEDPGADFSVGREQTYTNVDQIELNGEPVDVTLKVRVSDLRTRIASPPYLDPGAGNRYVRMTIAIDNVGKDAYSRPQVNFRF